MDNEELDLAQRFAKQDLNQSRSDFTTQTDTVVNKNLVSNKKKVKREQHQTALRVKKIKKPQHISYESKISSSQGLHKFISAFTVFHTLCAFMTTRTLTSSLLSN